MAAPLKVISEVSKSLESLTHLKGELPSDDPESEKVGGLDLRDSTVNRLEASLHPKKRMRG